MEQVTKDKNRKQASLLPNTDGRVIIYVHIHGDKLIRGSRVCVCVCLHHRELSHKRIE